MQTSSAILVLLALTAFTVGMALMYIIMLQRLQALREKNAALETAQQLSAQNHQQQVQALQQQNEKMSHTFSALASEALNRNSESFLKLAQEKLTQSQMQNKHDLEQKEKSIETMLKPLREALEKTESQIRSIEKERKEAYGSLSKHLESMAQSQQVLQSETRNLVQALRRPEVRGQWGEMTLKRLAELAGLVEHCDFFEQTHVKSDEGMLRPDMVVRLPGGRDIIIDAKTPLDAYLNAIDAAEPAQRDIELQRHARTVKERVKELSLKSYWEQFEQTPEFVVLFIPGEQFLSAALDIDRSLLEYAFQQKIILATPTTLVALLRAVAYGWRQEKMEANAQEIRKLGEELFHRIATLTDHLGKLGKSLDGSVGHFNKVVGTLDSRVLPSARKFTELGISDEKKPIPPLDQIERTSKHVE